MQAAYEFGAEAHRGQKRLSGEPYISHPVAAANILAELHMDAETLIAAILHDVIEDTPTAKTEIANRFGSRGRGARRRRHQARPDSLQEPEGGAGRELPQDAAGDGARHPRGAREARRSHSQHAHARLPCRRPSGAPSRVETLEIYAPIAERLGLYTIKLELEDLGFRALYPHRYRVLEKELKRARGNQKQFVGKISEALKGALAKASIKAIVDGREKHLYSVYKKMRKKGIALSEIVDVYGFRIVVDSVDTCYRVLGVVHGVYKPMPGRFKDYIAIARVNGYQSLHTTLFGPNGVPIEVQIRTEDMHKVAEAGIAAHWKYKGGPGTSSTPADRARQWLSQLVEIQEGGNSEEFLESVKVDLFPDKVYVFTPRGEILRLPRGATTVDFAYAVHTDIGNRCVAAKIDRRLVPLRTTLRNGQTVEIITAKGARPNPSWVNFVVSAKAQECDPPVPEEHAALRGDRARAQDAQSVAR